MKAIEVLPGDVVRTRTGRAVRVYRVGAPESGALTFDGVVLGSGGVITLVATSPDTEVTVINE